MDYLRRLDATGYPLLIARLIVGLVFLFYGIEKSERPHRLPQGDKKLRHFTAGTVLADQQHCSDHAIH